MIKSDVAELVRLELLLVYRRPLSLFTFAIFVLQSELNWSEALNGKHLYIFFLFLFFVCFFRLELVLFSGARTFIYTWQTKSYEMQTLNVLFNWTNRNKEQKTIPHTHNNFIQLLFIDAICLNQPNMKKYGISNDFKPATKTIVFKSL